MVYFFWKHYILNYMKEANKKPAQKRNFERGTTKKMAEEVGFEPKKTATKAIYYIPNYPLLSLPKMPLVSISSTILTNFITLAIGRA